MSSVAATVIRRLESFLGNIKSDLVFFISKVQKILEYIMVKLVCMSMRAESSIIRSFMKVSKYFDRIQKSLYKSTVLASLWIGLLFTISFLILAILTLLGG